MAHQTRCFTFILIWTMVTATYDWTTHCNKCKCLWSSGKKSADCRNLSLTKIPQDMSTDIRDFDFSDNPLYELKKDVLFNAEMQNAHELKFRNCSLQTVDKTAFQDLLLLIELDLSRNTITALHNETFKYNTKLRMLSLSYNNLDRLEPHLFYNLTHLQKIFLDHNRIESIGPNVFVSLPLLHNLNLGNNQLKRMTFDITKEMPKIGTINLEGNQWICDCLLQEFRYKTIKENLIPSLTKCAEPERLKGRSWTEPVTFDCVPDDISEPTEKNVKFMCRVLGDSEPEANWVMKGKIIDKNPGEKTQRFDSLTIFDAKNGDVSEYKYVAKN